MEDVIIDTDPGVDDALAISLACYSQLNIRAITTVYGNSNVKNTTKNALAILEFIKKSVPVYEGLNKPLKGKGILASCHGKNGLGGLTKKITSKKMNIPAIAYLSNFLTLSKQKSVIFICIGPLTNIASLFLKKPPLIDKVKEIIILGGVFFESGNITPYAEFNAYNDPYALKYLLELKCKKILIPINICRNVILTIKEFNKILDQNLGKDLKNITDIYINYYINDEKYGGFKGGVMYDLLAVAYLINKKFFKLQPSNVEVEVKNPIKYGSTVVRKNMKPNCLLVKKVNSEKIKNLFFNVLNRR